LTKISNQKFRENLFKTLEGEKVLNLSTDALKVDKVENDRKRPRKRVEDKKRIKRDDIKLESRVADASFGATIESGKTFFNFFFHRNFQKKIEIFKKKKKSSKFSE